MSRQADDLVLIQRAQQGDKTAFDDLVRIHERRAYQYAYRLTSNPDEACDVVADAFIRVYGALNNFKGNSAFSTWLYRILTNCFLDLRKKEKSRATVSLDQNISGSEQEMERQIEDDGPGPDDVAEMEERQERVSAAVERLPEYQKAMIVMYHSEGLAYEEIAEALDLPIGTVKSRLNRARLTLREMLVKDAELFNIG